MTLLENLLVAQHNKLMRASGFTILGLLGLGGYAKASAESVDLAKFWLEKADLVDRADDAAGDLPYGAQRRLEIARAMCTGPELLCLDEPAAGLNPRESAALNGLLNDIKSNTGTSILLIEHDMSVVMQISDHVVVLEYGRKISDGDPNFVKNDPRVIAAYLGVDDEEVSEVLAEVGDEGIIEQFDGEPDPAHGPAASSSMMAGPISDTIGHSNGDGETIKVSRGASRADLVAPLAAVPEAQRGKVAAAAKRSAKADVKVKAAVAAPKTAGPKAAAPKATPKVVAVMTPPTSPKTKPTASKAAAAKPGLTSNALTQPRGGKSDDLKLIKGIGPVNERKLNAHGIFHFDQIAAWTKADIAAAEAYLAFDGRIGREDWIGQAKGLAKAAQAEPAKSRGRK